MLVANAVVDTDQPRLQVGENQMDDRQVLLGNRECQKICARAVLSDIDEPFAEDDGEVADQLRPKVPKLAVLMDEAEHDVLAYMSFPREHRQKLHSTNPIERLHAEVKRRTNVVGIFPNEAAITRLVGAILLEQNDEWAVSRRYMTLESIAPLSDGVPITLPTVAA